MTWALCFQVFCKKDFISPYLSFYAAYLIFRRTYRLRYIYILYTSTPVTNAQQLSRIVPKYFSGFT